METVLQFIQTLFIDIPPTEERNALRQQITDNAQALYDELVGLGISQGEATRTVINSIDSQEDILRQLDLPLGIIDSTSSQYLPSDSRRQHSAIQPQHVSKDEIEQSEEDELEKQRKTLPDDKLVLPFEETFSGVYWVSALVLWLSGWNPLGWTLLTDNTPVYFLIAAGLFVGIKGILLRIYGIPKSKRELDE